MRLGAPTFVSYATAPATLVRIAEDTDPERATEPAAPARPPAVRLPGSCRRDRDPDGPGHQRGEPCRPLERCGHLRRVPGRQDDRVGAAGHRAPTPRPPGAAGRWRPAAGGPDAVGCRSGRAASAGRAARAPTLGVLRTSTDVDAGDLLSKYVAWLEREHREISDVVIFDPPPLLNSDEARVLSAAAGSTVLVMSDGQPAADVASAVGALGSTDDPGHSVIVRLAAFGRRAGGLGPWSRGRRTRSPPPFGLLARRLPALRRRRADRSPRRRVP